jgi:hypothetical protein
MYKTSEAARPIGMPRHTLMSWLDRRVVELGGGDVDEGSSGVPRLLSMPRVVQIAIAHEMTKLGLNPTRAAEAAALFTDKSQPGRATGRPFPTGRTLLVVSATATEVINAPHAEPSNFGASIVVDCGATVERIDRALSPKRRAA